MTLARRCGGAALGLALDQVVGELRLGAAHPVALFGRAMGRVERLVYADRRAPGSAHVAVGVTGAAAAGALVRSTTAATYLACSGRALHEAASVVERHLLDDDLHAARLALRSLVGRDPRDLDADAIARAAIESVAENTVDAVVAPALWAAAGGAVGVLAHRAADTLDSMVGYRDDRYRHFGWAAARADDALAYWPARATAVMVAAVRPTTARAVRDLVVTDAHRHPSPNAGVAEAAFAAALGLRLGGDTNRYGDRTEERPALGSGRAPRPGDIGRAVTLSRQVTWALTATLATVAIATHAGATPHGGKNGRRGWGR